jgi:hypothetical protein
MRIAERSAAVVGVAAMLFASGPARAANPAAQPAAQAQVTPDQARIDAEKRNAEGLERYQRGDYDGARLAFQQAWAVLASVDLLYNLARAEVKSGHALEAIVHLRQILRNTKATPDDREKAQRLLDDANRVTAHIAVEAPAGATIYIDKIESGDAPVGEAFDVTPGKHVCEARANGAARVIEVEASVGAVVTARFALDQARAPTVSAPVPVAGPQPVAASGESAPVDDGRGEHRHHHGREASARVIVPIVIAGGAVIAAGIGAAFGLVSKGKEDDAATFRANNPPGFCSVQTSGTCGQYASILSSQQSATNAERVLLVTGGVLAVGAVVTYLVWPHGDGMERAHAWVGPQVGPGGGGVVVGGMF